MANFKFDPAKPRLTAAEMIALATKLEDALPKHFHKGKPPTGVDQKYLKIVHRDDKDELTLKDKLKHASCMVQLEGPNGNPKYAASAKWDYIIQLYPGADAPKKVKSADAPMAAPRNVVLDAGVLAVLKTRWEDYYAMTRPEAQRKWSEDRSKALKTADFGDIARERDPKKRAKMLRDLADQEDQNANFSQYLAAQFGSEMVTLLGIPDVGQDTRQA
jgi:hypothetical protein